MTEREWQLPISSSQREISTLSVFADLIPASASEQRSANRAQAVAHSRRSQRRTRFAMAFGGGIDIPILLLVQEKLITS